MRTLRMEIIQQIDAAACCVMFTLSQLHFSTCTGRLILRFEVTGEDILGRVLTWIPTTVRYVVVGSPRL